MTMHFNDFEIPSALEDELAGCPVRKRIDAVCTEPGCPNNGTDTRLQQRIQLEDCIRVDEPPSTLLRSGPVRQGPVDIYQTQPKDRCVM